MKRIAKADWDHVHELACAVVHASSQEDAVLIASKTEELMSHLEELQTKYGVCSKITATIADYAEEERRPALYREALKQAKVEGDTENEQMILESLAELTK